MINQSVASHKEKVISIDMPVLLLFYVYIML